MITHDYHQHHSYHYYPSVQRQSSISTLSCIQPRQRRGDIKKRAGAQEKKNKEMHDGSYCYFAVLSLLFLSMNKVCPEAVHPRGPAEGAHYHYFDYQVFSWLLLSLSFIIIIRTHE